ncbi:uncharacterized protein LOC123291327 [Chrysoperla carnea]|uniref:uncharacterized protein LOC123291327 n=1 Tax=Chrysoperla carnea TaxID=189513 RepID=UPI001D089392|nr:uncharacterized protein LOC123291327 [Chrysoperla carnea]
MKNFSETDMKIKVAEAVQNYGQKDYQKDTEFLDEIHKTFKCCGLEGADDFKGFSLKPTAESNYFASSGDPKSCFDNKNNLWKRGFKEAIEYVPTLIKAINILILLLTFLLLVNSNRYL